MASTTSSSASSSSASKLSSNFSSTPFIKYLSMFFLPSPHIKHTDYKTIVYMFVQSALYYGHKLKEYFDGFNLLATTSSNPLCNNLFITYTSDPHCPIAKNRATASRAEDRSITGMERAPEAAQVHVELAHGCRRLDFPWRRTGYMDAGCQTRLNSISSATKVGRKPFEHRIEGFGYRSFTREIRNLREKKNQSLELNTILIF